MRALPLPLATMQPPLVEKTMRVHVDVFDALEQGDVLILKKQLVGRRGKLFTICTHCHAIFPTTFRQMKKGQAVFRNLSQCGACRGRYGHGRRGER